MTRPTVSQTVLDVLREADGPLSAIEVYHRTRGRDKAPKSYDATRKILGKLRDRGLAENPRKSQWIAARNNPPDLVHVLDVLLNKIGQAMQSGDAVTRDILEAQLGETYRESRALVSEIKRHGYRRIMQHLKDGDQDN